MRRITVHRKKKAVACASAVLIYTVEGFDAEKPINRESLTLLGKLKNGACVEGLITESEITVIAAYNSLGMFMITDCVTLPRGTNAVALTGEVKLNPFRGNPFFFAREC